jgi:hemolysin activation/secretion protein
VLKYALFRENKDSLIGQILPYGAKNFGQIGLKFGFNLDTRDPARANSAGFGFNMEAFFYPKLWHVESNFGGVEGDVYTTIPLGKRLVLALRAGGKKVFGTYPFYEAAFLGGLGTIRGLQKERFVGDASLFGNAELRLTLGKAVFVVPGEYGIFGLADVGQVYLEGESSSKWHPAYGGGLFFSILDLSTVFTFGVASTDERIGVYFKAGFWF